MKSVTERLADKFGGVWEFDREEMRWVCTDGSKVCRVLTGGVDEDRRPCPFFVYWMYWPSGLSYEITL